MTYDPQKHHRRSIRLKGYDYRRTGAYFVTLVTYGREGLFGEIVAEAMRPNEFGAIVTDDWRRISRHFVRVTLDEFVVMPNHVHGVIVLGWDEASAGRGPEIPAALSAEAAPQRPIGTQSGSLGAIVQNYKSVTTRKINQRRCTPGVPVWQRNYYERIIRDEGELNRIRRYIIENPLRWALDDNNPLAHGDVSR
ncbi:MAG: transposase [Anaerolineales bacterium]